MGSTPSVVAKVHNAAWRAQADAEACQPLVAAPLPLFEPQRRFDHQRRDAFVEFLTSAAAAKEMPGLEDASLEIQKSLGPNCGPAAGAAAIPLLFDVAFDVSPAELPAIERPLVVDAPTIAAQDADHRFAEQMTKSLEIPQRMNGEDDDPSRRGSPEPTLLAVLFPAGFVDVLDGSGGDGGLGLLMGLCQGGAGFLFQIGDRPQSDRRVEELVGDFLDAAFADAVIAGEVREGGGHAGSDAVGPDLGGDRGMRDLAAAGTGSGMSLVFRDDGHQGRKFDDLMPGRRRIERAGLFRQRRSTTAALRGQERNDVVDAFGRQQSLEVRRMSRLSAGLSAGRLLGGSGRLRFLDSRRRRRLETVLEIADDAFEDEELRLHGDNLRFEFSDANIALATSWTFRHFHADTLADHDPCSCAGFPYSGTTTR